MPRVKWDIEGERLYETGVRHGMLYPYNPTSKKYKPGVAWNGLSSVTESPSGAEANPIYADNMKYLNLLSAEEFGGTIEAYMYPDAFAECDGSVSIREGVMIGQQPRKKFGFSYETIIGNDLDKENYGRKIHCVYGATVSPSQKQYETVNESPNAMALSWEFTTEPIEVSDKKPTAILTIDCTKLNENQIKAVEDLLYGTDGQGSTTGTDPELGTPDEILAVIAAAPEPTPTPTTPADVADE